MSPSGDIRNLPFDWGYDDRNVPLIWRPPQEARLGRMGMSCKELRRAGGLARIESGVLLPRNSQVSQISRLPIMAIVSISYGLRILARFARHASLEQAFILLWNSMDSMKFCVRLPVNAALVVHRDEQRKTWSGRRGSNPQPTAWEAATLPLSYSRSASRVYRKKSQNSCRQ